MHLLLLLLALGCGGDEPKDCTDFSAAGFGTDQSAWWPDTDADGFGDSLAASETSCEAPGDGWVTNARDCDDTNENTWPGATETCDGLDNDCDDAIDEDASGGTNWYADADGDGYGDSSASLIQCYAPPEYVADNTDCDDTESTTNPGATEYCDGHDDDCDGTVDENDSADASNTYYLDEDGDGIGTEETTTTACSLPAGYADKPGDCDDSNSSEPGWADANASSSGDGTAVSPYDSIQQAVTSGHACVVALPGTYSETITVDSQSVQISALEGPSVTFVAGTNGPAFVLESTPSVQIEGFTIIDGQGLNAADDYLTELGNAFFVDGGNVWLKNVVVDGIEADLLHHGQGDNNGGTGIYATHGAVVDLEDVTLQNLQGTWGVAIYISESTVTGRRVSFFNNGVGFSLVHIVGGLELDAVQVVGNYQIEDSYPTDRVLLYLYDGQVRIGNATIVDNDTSYISATHDARDVTDPNDQGAWYSMDSSIVAFNSEAQLFQNFSTGLQPKVSNTDMFGNSANDSSTWIDQGENLVLDPLLVFINQDATFSGDDLHLLSTSPCIDAGPSTGFDPDGSRADMGAYGGQFATW